MSRRISSRVAALCFAYFLGAGFGHSAWAMSPSHPPVNSDQTAATVWLTDYAKAIEAARSQEKLLLVFFRGEDPRSKEFESQTLADPQIAAKLQALVNVKLPLDAKLTTDQGEVQLLQHQAFTEMRGLPGVAILDFAHKDAPYYGCVVSTFPLLPQLSFTPREMAVILDLPPGTLTQRTLIYAVRIHPERPASANGKLDPNLVGEAHSSADYQARIGRQGAPFLGNPLPPDQPPPALGLLASEVCRGAGPAKAAQAAIECVRCWRYLPATGTPSASPTRSTVTT